MLQRNLWITDIIHVLQNADYEGTAQSEWSAEYQNWVYSLVGPDPERRFWKIVFVFEGLCERLCIISSYPQKRKRS